MSTIQEQRSCLRYIVDIDFPYNAIIGRGTLNIFEAVLPLHEDT
jgi:hypothetical protein